MLGLRRTRKIFQNYKESRDGATAVEFALVSVIFMFFVFGIMETGRLWWVWNRFQYGVEIATRYASVHDDATIDELRKIVVDQMSLVQLDDFDISLTIENTVLDGMNFIEIDGRYSFQAMAPLIGDSLGSIDVVATSRVPTQLED